MNNDILTDTENDAYDNIEEIINNYCKFKNKNNISTLTELINNYPLFIQTQKNNINFEKLNYDDLLKLQTQFIKNNLIDLYF